MIRTFLNKLLTFWMEKNISFCIWQVRLIESMMNELCREESLTLNINYENGNVENKIKESIDIVECQKVVSHK